MFEFNLGYLAESQHNVHKNLGRFCGKMAKFASIAQTLIL